MREGDIVADRFVIEALSGAGGMGAVYRARDRATARRVALKVLNEGGGDPRFEREARVLADLDHPAIVRYVAHGQSGAQPAFLVMEWLDGEDLRARLARERLSLEDALVVVRRAASALGAAHERGVVHRDIKPGNLFLPDGDPARTTVLDFGIARAKVGGGFDTTEARITNTGLVVGTVGYMSPEQARGTHEVDARTDVFALGCVLFECLTGRPAFVGANAVAVLARLLLEEAPRVRHFEPSVPVALDELVARMLAKDPAARPRDGAALCDALLATGPGRLEASSSGAGDREQRLATIVLADHVDAAAARATVEGPLLELADGSVLVELGGSESATRAAVCALSFVARSPAARVAIATGRLSAPRAYGPIIDRAATLRVGEGIRVDEVSTALLGDRFEVVDGRLLGPARARPTARTLLGRATPCVGRDKELGLIEATFREVESEPIARAVLVTGVAGSGKTRLGHELLAKVGGDATVLIARGDPVGAGAALGLARQLVRSAAGLRDGAPAAAQREALRGHLERFFSGDVLRRTSEMLGELVGSPPEVPGPELRGARDDARVLASWLSRSFGEWMAALSDAGPVLAVIEDLHWGDLPSVTYLDEALRANASRPLMVLALARPEVHDLFPGLWSRVDLQEVRLPGLTRRAAERLVKAVLPDAPPELVARLVARADGNAFHLEELLRHVAERDESSLPDSLLALAEARISGLDAEARRLLRVASVFGETFWEAGVAPLLGEGGDTAVVLGRLVRAEVIAEGPGRKAIGGEYVFRHGLIRDAAYAMLTEDDRRALHLRAGEWLDATGETEPLVLAEHFERAGARERAAPCYLGAAEAAAEGMNVAAADDLAARGVLCGAEGEVLGRLRVVQAVAAVGRGDHGAAVTSAKEAYRLLVARTPRRYLAASIVLASGVAAGDLELAPDIVHELLTTAPEGPPNGPYGLAVRTVADILDGLGQDDGLAMLLANADALAAATPDCDRAYLAAVDFARSAMLLRRDGDLGQSVAVAERGAKHAEAVPDRMTQLFYRFGLGLLSVEVGELERARSELKSTGRTFSESGAPMFASWCAIHVGWAYQLEGRHREVLAVLGPELESPDFRHAHALAALACVEMGEPSQAEAHVSRALGGVDDEHLTPFVKTVVLIAAARVALARGRLDEAGAHVATAYETTAAKTGPGIVSLLDDVQLRVLEARGDADAYREALSRAARRIERHAASLPEPRRTTYRTRVPVHARVLALADQRR